ncbi:NRDE family protein [Mangrovimonas cancribranchiae]|uniref:NRDE family protein n=1 Tax=Mangrovimonas cancribranchiae TaxID=3080055 RepID=A0AAU6P2F5_9FLAO
MCTVTLAPQGQNSFVLTSNRDEAPGRENLAPTFYNEDGVKLLYPKDSLAGGTWIGVSEKQRLICLLNGGFNKHKRKEEYRLSRGVVVKDLLTCEDFKTEVASYDLNGVEPFTIVCVEWIERLRFLELVWDGNKKHVKDLPLEPHIWSSSTLYTASMKQERKLWFETFKKETALNTSTLLKFHKHAGENNDDFGVIMDRGFVKTTSITQVEKCNHLVTMQYEDLQTSTRTSVVFDFNLIHEK